MNARKFLPVIDSSREQLPLSRLEQKNLLRHRFIQLRKLSHSMVGAELVKIKEEMAHLHQKIQVL